MSLDATHVSETKSPVISESAHEGSRPAHVFAFQWARAFGSIAVVLLHALIAIQIAGDYDALGSRRILIESWVALVCTRWAVPVFFMMSGALMLDPRREMGWPKIWKHVWRMGFILLTFGLVFCLVKSAVNMGEFSMATVVDALVDFVCARSWDHMWFVYTLLGFYLVTPVLRPYVAQASERELRLTVIALVVMLQLVQTARTLLEWDLWQVVELPMNLTFYVLGYYVHTYLRFEKRYVIAAMASIVLMLVVKETQGAHWVGLPEHVFIVPVAIAVLLAFERYLEVPLDGHPLVALIADYSFGIYLVHPIFQHLAVRYLDVAAYPAVLFDVGLAVVSLALSVPTVWLLRKIPGFSDKL